MSDDAPRGSPLPLLRVGVVARRSGVSPDTVRYYEDLGLLDPPDRSPAGYRLFKPDVLERLAFIRKAQALGLTLSEVGDIVRASMDGAPPCEHVRATLSARVVEVEARISDLHSLRDSLRQALRRAHRLPVATSCVCGIIESHALPEEKA